MPASQHRDASAVLLEVLGEEEWSFCYGLRRAVLRVMAFWAGFTGLVFASGIWVGAIPWPQAMLWPLSVFTTPANPQGRGDYYLRREDGTTYRT